MRIQQDWIVGAKWRFDGRRRGGCRAGRPRESGAGASAVRAADGDRGVPGGNAFGEERGEFGGMGLEERGGIRRGGVEDDGHLGAGDVHLDGGTVEDGGFKLDADLADAALFAEDLGLLRLDDARRAFLQTAPYALSDTRLPTATPKAVKAAGGDLRAVRAAAFREVFRPLPVKLRLR